MAEGHVAADRVLPIIRGRQSLVLAVLQGRWGVGAGSFEEDEEESEPEIVASLRAEIVQLAELETQKAKTGDLWRLNCEQLAEMDGSLVEKDEEISRLKDEVARLRRSSPSDNSEGASVESGGAPVPSRVRRGKAPPVDPFTGEDPECRLMIG